jgi:hypothetical protein
MHAAQALIFETNGRIYKSHGPVQGEFSRLVKDDARVDDQLRAFLGHSYSLKAIADYETGPVPMSRQSGRARPSTPRGALSNVSPVLCRRFKPTSPFLNAAGRRHQSLTVVRAEHRRNS